MLDFNDAIIINFILIAYKLAFVEIYISQDLKRL